MLNRGAGGRAAPDPSLLSEVVPYEYIRGTKPDRKRCCTDRRDSQLCA